jgi:hypothetical protein
MTASLNAQITLTNFAPSPSATVLSYGTPQDQATATNAAAVWQDLASTNYTMAGTNFNGLFPPLSLTLFTLAPAPAKLSVPSLRSGQLQLRLQGQPGTPYIIQSSPDLATWTSIATNTLTGNTLTITNQTSPSSPNEFYRAIWQP